MDWKFSWKRFGLSLSLLIVSLLLSVFLGAVMMGFFFPIFSLLISSIPGFIITTILLGLLSYIFAGRILNHHKKQFLAFLLAFIVLQIGLFLILLGYNATIGRLCTKDSQCHHICGEGTQGLLFIRTPIIGAHFDCFRAFDGVCDNRYCKRFEERDPPSMKYCSRTENKWLQMACFENAAKKFNTTSCDGEEYCIAQLAQTAETCRELTDSEAQQECIYQVAEEKNDSALCYELTGYRRNNCFTEVAVSLRDPELCEKAGEGNRYCFRRLAYLNEDVSLCRRIQPSSGTIPDIRNDCLAEIAELTGDLALCDEIPEEKKYLSWANTTKQGLEWRNCIEGASTTLHNRTSCYRIIDQYDRDFCLWHVAVFNNDTSFCNEIQHDVWKNECEEQE